MQESKLSDEVWNDTRVAKFYLLGRLHEISRWSVWRDGAMFLGSNNTPSLTAKKDALLEAMRIWPRARREVLIDKAMQTLNKDQQDALMLAIKELDLCPENQSKNEATEVEE